MSIFKKPEKGFLAKLFKHKQVEELAEELAHTYADEMQADMLSDNTETDTAEDTAAEPVPMLEVTESGEVDFTEPPETTEVESPPQDTEPSEVRKHLITFRVNDMELEAINRRYAETSFRSRGDFCRYSALTVMNVEEDTEDIKQIARYISSISNSFNQVAHRVNKGGKLYDEDIADMKARLEEVWQLLVSIRSTREHTADGKYVVSNLCVSTPCGASEQFRNIRQTVGTGRSRSECQHIIQSFAPGEVTPERALLIGQELCKALFNDEYQYVLAVHVDHSHVHNHIIVNNVNFYTGKTFETEHNQGKIPDRAWSKLRTISDELCASFKG